jgi:DNA repair protein RadD
VQKAGKRVLCLVPNGDLVKQNAEKYRMTGNQCSIFSASLNRKHTGHPVVFATPKSVLNSLSDFNDEYALLAIDEAQIVCEDDKSTIQQIISHLRSKNPRLRIFGMTATPVRGKSKLVDSDKTFKHIIFELPHHVLSDLGWVVPYKMGIVHEHYDLINLKTQGNGKFKQSEVDDATLGQERLSKSIVSDFIRIMRDDNRHHAIIFVSSIKHGNEVLSYLPDGSASFITGDTDKKLRENVIDAARSKQWKFLLTVSALGTGTDIPCIDTVIFMRATESIGLLIQFLGRGCRLFDENWSLPPSQMNWKHPEYQGKKNCLVLDYGENIDRFSLDDDLTITGLVAEKNKNDDAEFFEIDCPDCYTKNRHTAQRCVGISAEGERCNYRFIFKECPVCNAKNSPSARDCYKCDAELINPNDKLTRNPAIAAGTPFYVAVISMSLRSHFKGDSQSLRIDYTVTDGDRTWDVSEYLKAFTMHRFIEQSGGISNTVDNAVLEAKTLTPPTRLMIRKKKGSKYFEVSKRYYDNVQIAA